MMMMMMMCPIHKKLRISEESFGFFFFFFQRDDSHFSFIMCCYTNITCRNLELHREIVPPRETVANARVAIAIVGRGG